MTPVPKKKHTRSRSAIRRGGQKKTKLPNLSRCPSCGKLRVSHTACPHCGFYR